MCGANVRTCAAQRGIRCALGITSVNVQRKCRKMCDMSINNKCAPQIRVNAQRKYQVNECVNARRNRKSASQIGVNVRRERQEMRGTT